MMFPGYMDPSWAGWMMAVSGLFWIALVAIVAVVIVRITRPRRGNDDAVAILDERLARGEIDADEYRSRRNLLLQSS